MYEWWVEIHELRVQIQELQVQIHDLPVQNQELRVQIYELLVSNPRVTSSNLRIIILMKLKEIVLKVLYFLRS